jgi:hypothetical protein
LWQLHLKGGIKVVEYLLKLKVHRQNVSSNFTIEMSSLRETDLPVERRNILNSNRKVRARGQWGPSDA